MIRISSALSPRGVLLLGTLAVLAGCGISTLSADATTGGGDNTYAGPEQSDGGYESDGGNGGGGGPSDAAAHRGNALCNLPIDGTSCNPDEVPATNVCGPKPAPIADGGTDAEAGTTGTGASAACHVRASDDAGTAAPVCLAAGTGHNGDACLAPTDCAAGFECVGSPGQCRPYCCSGKCSTTSFCDVQPVSDVGAVRVPVCEPVRTCKLLSTMGCESGETCAIVNDDTGTTSCVSIGPAQVGQACEATHCAANLTCLGQPGSRKCYQLCSKTSNTPYACPSGEQCKGSAPLFNDSSIGVCQKI